MWRNRPERKGVGGSQQPRPPDLSLPEGNQGWERAPQVWAPQGPCSSALGRGHPVPASEEPAVWRPLEVWSGSHRLWWHREWELWEGRAWPG